MESITNLLSTAIQKRFPELDLPPIAGKSHGKLRLGPAQLLAVIHAQQLAEWSLHTASRFRCPHLRGGPGGRATIYQDSSVLLMAMVQTAWRMSYEQVVDHVAHDQELARGIGFQGHTISQGQYWERRAALGVLSILLFFLALVAQLIRLGAVVGE